MHYDNSNVYDLKSPLSVCHPCLLRPMPTKMQVRLNTSRELSNLYTDYSCVRLPLIFILPHVMSALGVYGDNNDLIQLPNKWNHIPYLQARNQQAKKIEIGHGFKIKLTLIRYPLSYLPWLYIYWVPLIVLKIPLFKACPCDISGPPESFGQWQSLQRGPPITIYFFQVLLTFRLKIETSWILSRLLF